MMNFDHIMKRLRNRTAAFVHDLLMLPVAWLGALWVRFNLEVVPSLYLDAALHALPVVIVVQGAVGWRLGLYRGVWRFASLPDLIRIVKSVAIGVVLIAAALFLWTRLANIPRSVFLLYGVLLIMLLGGPRLLYRWFKDRRLYAEGGRKVLVVGAGQAGEMLVRDLLHNASSGMRPIGFVDDALEKKGREIHGVRVLGTCEKIPRLVERMGIEMVLLAVPAASSADLRRLVELCDRAGVPMRTLPRVQELPAGEASAEALRQIAIEDLLGRDPVSLDWQAIRNGVSARSVMVTGGGGSIGAELCRQLAALVPAHLVVVDNSEFNLYRIERELRQRWPTLRVSIALVDVCDQPAIERLFAETRPSLVLHAAAYKHVPLLELQARQAVRNNVLGTRTLARAASTYAVERFVLISTDKAVNPTNVMGASKRLAEVYCQNRDVNRATRFITVRFGNVLDSAGSVVPLFREQIAAGGPVTVTHPEVKRYFMTIPEACELILQSAAVGTGGEVFVLDMGEPVSIAYLARQMILLAGKSPDRDIAIEYVGLRPGEKLFEELFHPSEALRQSGHAKLLLARHRVVDWEQFQAELDDLADACTRCDEPLVRRLLHRLVPEFDAEATGEHPKVIPIESRRR